MSGSFPRRRFGRESRAKPGGVEIRSTAEKGVTPLSTQVDEAAAFYPHKLLALGEIEQRARNLIDNVFFVAASSVAAWQ